MSQYYLGNRAVEVLEIDGEINEGAYVIEAYFVDTETDLTEDELDQLSKECAEQLYEDYYQKQVMRAEAAWERDR